MTYIRRALLPAGWLFSTLAILASFASSAAGQASSPPSILTKPDCFTRLAITGIKAERPADIPAPPYPACVITEPVILTSITAHSGQIILFPDRPLLSCAMAERLARFSADVAGPLALSAHGKQIDSISTGPGYECRPRNRQAGAKMSSHGQGNAVDIMELELAGGQKIVVEKPDGAADAKFLTRLRIAACEAFNTVLGPGADPSHANHIHIDIEPRGAKGISKFCQ